MIGTFHLICAYLKAIGKKMSGSGFSDILLEAGLIGTGSLKGVLSGKHYDRALHCHKVVLESLERLLYVHCLEENERMFENLPDVSKKIIETMIQCPSQHVLNELLEDSTCRKIFSKVESCKENIREGGHGKTAQFWLSYMDQVWRVLNLIRAVKTNDYDLYRRIIIDMPDLFFAYDMQNYARYTAYYSVFLTNIETTHPGASDLLRKGAISVARSLVPGSRCQVDKTMEETFIKHAKSHNQASGGSGAGLFGLEGNYNAYQRWVRSASERSKMVGMTLSMADMVWGTEAGAHHRDLRPSEIKRSEKEVHETIDAFHGFSDPFADSLQSLYCISSGAPMSEKIENDVLCAELWGHEQKTKFIADRLAKKKDFFQPIKRLNLKTMSDSSSKAIKLQSASKNKEIEYKQQGSIALQLLMLAQNPKTNVPLEEVLKYPLTPVPSSLGNPDGSMAKNEKSKGLKYLLKDCDSEPSARDDREVMVVEDGNAQFHSLVTLPHTFEQISEMLLKKLPKHSDVVFSTDLYKTISTKNKERMRRGLGEARVINGLKTKKPESWKGFLSNEKKTKKRLSNSSKKAGQIHLPMSSKGDKSFSFMSMKKC